jgi:hypothetical protein
LGVAAQDFASDLVQLAYNNLLHFLLNLQYWLLLEYLGHSMFGVDPLVVLSFVDGHLSEAICQRRAVVAVVERRLAEGMIKVVV